jgi:hypothetical protein
MMLLLVPAMVWEAVTTCHNLKLKPLALARQQYTLKLASYERCKCQTDQTGEKAMHSLLYSPSYFNFTTSALPSIGIGPWRRWYDSLVCWNLAWWYDSLVIIPY